MYCKKCNRLLKNSSEKCPYCDFDNTINITDITNELRENIKPKKKKDTQKQVILIIVLMFIISLFFIIIYSIKDLKKDNTLNPLNRSTTTEIKKTKVFKYKNYTMNYPNNFGISKSTIFYKDNSNINIEINNINEDEYNQLKESNEYLESTIGDFNSLTFAEDNSYSHIFIDNNKYYRIKVNYLNDTSVYTEQIQLDISNILNSLKKK